MIKKRDKLIKLYVDSETYDLILNLSRENNRSISNFVFMIVNSFLKNYIRFNGVGDF